MEMTTGESTEPNLMAATTEIKASLERHNVSAIVIAVGQTSSRNIFYADNKLREILPDIIDGSFMPEGDDKKRIMDVMKTLLGALNYYQWLVSGVAAVASGTAVMANEQECQCPNCVSQRKINLRKN